MEETTPKTPKGAIVLVLALALALACVPGDRAESVLAGAGYTDVELGGYALMACSEDDTLKRSFTARGPTGVQVSGAVCCGVVVKNCTIRASKR